MKNFKRFICLLLTISMLMGISGFAAEVSADGSVVVTPDMPYTLLFDASTGTITGIDYDSSLTFDVVIPSEIDGVPVVAIGDAALDWCESMVNIIIPDSVTYIGAWAFWFCDSLTSVTIPDSVTYIGDDAFESCDNLMNIYVDDNNTEFCSIDGVLFSKSRTELICYPAGRIATEYNIPDSVTYVGDDAFDDCSSLTSVTIPDSVTYIGNNAFSWCSSLTSITIPDSVTSIEWTAFSNCQSLTSITIPDSVTYIGNGAFLGCDSLTDVYYNGAEAEWNAIEICDSNECLTDANIYYASVDPEPTPEMPYTLRFDASTGTITGIDYDSSLTFDVVIPYEIDGIPVVAIGDRAFYECVSLTNIVIPDSVMSIGNSAFYGCTLLNEANIPYGVESIGNSAFSNCTNLFNVVIPDSVISIGSWAFGGCSSLYYLSIGEGVQTIGERAFRDCIVLSSVYIPKNVSSIGQSTFYGCTELLEINVAENNEFFSSEDGVLFNKDKTELICFPAYKDGVYYIPEGVESITKCAFYGCSRLSAVSIPGTIASIGNYAFQGCGATEVTIPEVVTSIGKGVFNSCYNLTDVYYGGTEYAWNNVVIGEENESLYNATIHFASVDPVLPEPTATAIPQPTATPMPTATTVPMPTTTAIPRPTTTVIPDPYVDPVISVSEAGNVKPGYEFTVTVDMLRNPGFTDVGIELEYDTSVLKLVNVENVYEVGGSFTKAENLEEMPYNMGWNNADNIYYNGTLATLTFRVADDAPEGYFPIYVNYYKGINGDWIEGVDVNCDENGEPIYFAYVNGGVGVVYRNPETDPIVSISNPGRVRPGERVEVTVDLSRNVGFSNLGIEIGYDQSVMKLVDVTESADVDATYTGAENKDVFPFNMSWTSAENVDYNGTLATLTFEISEDAYEGYFPIYVDYYKGFDGSWTEGADVNYDENGRPVYLVYQYGELEIKNRMPGDINGDWKVNAKDGTAILRHFADWDIEVIEDSVDTNGDGAKDNKDVTNLLRYLAGWNVEVY